MNKEQQIIEWFDKNKEEFYKKASECSSNGIINYIKHADNLNTYRDFLSIIDYFENVKEVNINDIEIEKLIFNLCIVVRYYFKFGYSLEGLFDDIKDNLLNIDILCMHTIDKSIKKYGFKYVAMELYKYKNEFQYAFKNQSSMDWEFVKDCLEYLIIYVIDILILVSIYMENNKE